MTVASVLAHVQLTQAQSIADLLHKAQAGDAKSQYDLAEAYFEGNGIAKDPKQGLVWLRKSAGQGYGGAEATLGFFYQKGFYQNGVEIEPDAQEAANWYRKAARQNIAKAQTHLSEMLSQGLISQKEADWATPEPVKEVKQERSRAFFSCRSRNRTLRRHYQQTNGHSGEHIRRGLQARRRHQKALGRRRSGRQLAGHDRRGETLGSVAAARSGSPSRDTLLQCSPPVPESCAPAQR